MLLDGYGIAPAAVCKKKMQRKQKKGGTRGCGLKLRLPRP
jgi:hypothetical protein